MGDRKKFNDLLGSYAASNPNITDAKATAEAIQCRTFSSPIDDAATAGTAFTETPMGTVRRGGIVRKVYFKTPIAVTANDTNYATITVSKRTAGGAASIVATGNTQTTGLGSLTAFNPYSLTLTAANVALAAGDELTVLVSKTGTGVALTAATSLASVSVDVYEVD